MTAAVRRYQGRKTLNRVSGIDACGGCGRRVLDPDTGVIYAKSSRGYVVTIGLVRCGRIWFCPECSAAIRQGRTEEIKTGALRHLAAGGTLAVVVLTARHNRTTDLGDLVAALWGGPLLDDDGAPVLDRSGKPRRAPGAYQRMLTAPAFYGRPEARRTRKDGSQYVRPAEEGLRHRIGYVGMVRAAEVTRSWENGYHPHLNLLVFLGGELSGTPAKGDVTGHFEPSTEALEDWTEWLRGMWAGALKRADPAFEPSTDCTKANCKCDGKGHGVMVQIVKSADDAALIEYLTKAQDGKPRGPRPESVDHDLDAAAGAAMETARADNKTGRGRRSMTPFQMLYRLWDIEVARLDPDEAEGYGTPAQLRAWWAQYEDALAGRRAIEWTRGLRRHVDLDGDDEEETDLQYVYEAEAAPLDGGVILTAEAMRLVVDADAELAVEDVVKAETYDSAVDVVTALGGRPNHVRIATAEELAEAQEALFARVQERAEESRRQRRIAEFEADQAETPRRLVVGLIALVLDHAEGRAGWTWTWTRPAE
ncbi:replication protein [Streptomyces sp. NPDC059556]|uniref:replication protein n=1 Tax=Streptomyces sp. NPDC059556 TaxID=3346863 RepID=UPI00369430A2